MSSKPVKFFSPPSVLIEVAIPNTKVDEALRKMRGLVNRLRLKTEIKERRPDTNFPEATFFAIMVSPNYRIKSAEKLVEASHAITNFQALLQATIFAQNNPNIF